MMMDHSNGAASFSFSTRTEVSATGFDQLYAMFTTAVRSASDKPEQTDQLPIEEINSLVNAAPERRYL